MRVLAAVLCALLAATVAASPRASDAQAKRPTASYPRAEQPMYGGIPANPAEQENDRRYIEEAARLAGDRGRAANMATDLGFRYFFRGDLAGAIRRFNQAWLLDAENGDAYHGMALVVFDRDDDRAMAEQLFKTALSKSSTSIGAWSDYGRMLAIAGRTRESVDVLDGALKRTFPGNPNPEGAANARALLAMGLAELRDFPRACREARAVPAEAQKPLLQGAAQVLALPECKGI